MKVTPDQFKAAIASIQSSPELALFIEALKANRSSPIATVFNRADILAIKDQFPTVPWEELPAGIRTLLESVGVKDFRVSIPSSVNEAWTSLHALLTGEDGSNNSGCLLFGKRKQQAKAISPAANAAIGKPVIKEIRALSFSTTTLDIQPASSPVIQGAVPGTLLLIMGDNFPTGLLDNQVKIGGWRTDAVPHSDKILLASVPFPQNVTFEEGSGIPRFSTISTEVVVTNSGGSDSIPFRIDAPSVSPPDVYDSALDRILAVADTIEQQAVNNAAFWEEISKADPSNYFRNLVKQVPGLLNQIKVHIQFQKDIVQFLPAEGRQLMKYIGNTLFSASGFEQYFSALNEKYKRNSDPAACMQSLQAAMFFIIAWIVYKVFPIMLLILALATFPGANLLVIGIAWYIPVSWIMVLGLAFLALNLALLCVFQRLLQQ